MTMIFVRIPGLKLAADAVAEVTVATQNINTETSLMVVAQFKQRPFSSSFKQPPYDSNRNKFLFSLATGLRVMLPLLEAIASKANAK